MKISVVIPAYNAELYLSGAMDSVFIQSHAADEVIVVDDCSTDRTREVARRYGATVLSTAVNSGHAAARNVGIAAASGDVIAWVDADDYWEPNHLETVCGLLEQHPSAAVAFSAVREVGERSGIWSGFPCSGGPANVFESCLRDTLVPAMSAVTRRQPLAEAGGFDAAIRVAPDFDLWLRLSRRHLFVSTDQVTANYRFHGGQISANRFAQKVSVNRSRMKLLSMMRAGPAEPFDSPLKNVLEAVHQYYEADVEAMWKRRRLRELRMMVPLASGLPELCWRVKRILYASRAPRPLIVAWDAVTRPRRRQTASGAQV